MMQTTAGVAVGALVALGIGAVWDDAYRLFNPPEPTLIFQGTPSVGEVTKGHAKVVYYMKRTESCETSIHIRWYNVDTNSFAHEYSSTITAVRANVTDDFAPFPLSLTVPSHPGTWGYAPVVNPGEGCAYQDAIYPPMAIVDVPG